MLPAGPWTVTRSPSFKPKRREVVGVEQDHVAAVDAAVDVFVFVDDRVELALAAERHQADLAVAGALQLRQLVRMKPRGRRAWRSCGS